MKYEMTNEEKLENYFKAVRMRLEGANKEEIIEKTEFPTWRVLEFFMNQNNLTLPLDKAAFNKNVDVTYFDEINTDAKAYILGFIYADGCIYDKGRFGFSITEDDSQILDFIKKEMKCENPIVKTHNKKGSANRRPQCTLRIGSTKLVEKLKTEYGINERKTVREGLVFPKIDEKLLSAFLRGLSDGDGNLYFKPNGNLLSKTVFRWTVCMTDKPFILSVKEYLESKGISISLVEKQGKTCKYYVMYTSSKSHTEKLCDILYQTDGFCLQRKKDSYLSFKQLR
jgi:hypothetical protein